jgi:hypothetical protein
MPTIEDMIKDKEVIEDLIEEQIEEFSRKYNAKVDISTNVKELNTVNSSKTRYIHTVDIKVEL